MPEDVDGVLELCHVLIKDQNDSGPGPNLKEVRRMGAYQTEREELAEEQGWVARMVHLFRAESLQVQFEVSCGCLSIRNNLLRYSKASSNCPKTL
jgi:vacuolar protein sorting-associated protein 35